MQKNLAALSIVKHAILQKVGNRPLQQFFITIDLDVLILESQLQGESLTDIMVVEKV